MHIIAFPFNVYAYDIANLKRFWIVSYFSSSLYRVGHTVSLSCRMLQMSAYFAPAFFSHLLGKCLRRRNPLLAVLKLGVAVVVTFVIVWWPYLHSLDDLLMVKKKLSSFW